MNVPRCVTVVVACSLLAGCGAVNGQLRSNGGNRARPAAHSQARCHRPPPIAHPGNAVASTNDIPLVPVPPVPLGRGAAPNPPPPREPEGAGPRRPRRQSNAGRCRPSWTSVRRPPSSADAPSRPHADASVEARPSPCASCNSRPRLWYAGVDSYIARLTRREVVNGTAKPEEILTVQLPQGAVERPFQMARRGGRRAAKSSTSRVSYENKIHTRLAAGDVPLTPAGTQMALAVDSLLVRSASRHSITEAGIGAGIDRLGALLDAQEHGDKSRGALTDLGLQKRPEYDQPVRGAELAIPAGVEPELPNGGRRQLFFDPEYHLPVLVVTHDDKNQEVEYYHYDRLLAPGHLDAADFDPDRLWSNPKPAAKVP